MTAVFLKLLNMGTAASPLMLAVFLLRFLLRRMPKWIACMLWALVAVRLVCPFSVESPFGLMPDERSLFQTAGIASESSGSQAYDTATGNLPSENITGNGNTIHAISENPKPQAATGDVNMRLTGFALQEPVQIKPDTLSLLCIVWMAGASLMVLCNLVGYRKLYRHTRASMPLRENIMLCDKIDVPFVLGMLSPRIYLPPGLDAAHAVYAIAHEKAHIKRHDHWWKPIGFCILSVYWFHPLCWISYLLFCRDIETACDEHVVKAIGFAEKKKYAEALLACSINPKRMTVCPLSFGETGTEKRIRNILHYKKPAFRAVSGALAACTVTAACFLTSPLSAQKAQPGKKTNARQEQGNAAPAKADKSDDIKTQDMTGQNMSDPESVPPSDETVLRIPANDNTDVIRKFMEVDWAAVKNLPFSERNYIGQDAIVCIGELPEYGIRVYGYNDDEIRGRGVAVETDGNVAYFDWDYTSTLAIYPKLYWDEAHRQLQLSFHIYTGTGADADILYILQYHDTMTPAPYVFGLDDYRKKLQEQVSFAFDEKNRTLTLYEAGSGKELASAKLPDGNVTDLEFGVISSFQLGNTITLQVTPGYIADNGGYGTAQYDNMPTLEFDVAMHTDDAGDIIVALENGRKR